MAVGKVALRMRPERGVRHGVPFDAINDDDSRFRLPEELQPIAERILQQVRAGAEVRLEPEQLALLRARYIHQSAHWIPTGALLVNKPAPLNQRRIYPDSPQPGYPQ
jgi:type VI secretion system secreted protein VgrG